MNQPKNQPQKNHNMATGKEQYLHIQKKIRKHLKEIEEKLISHEQENCTEANMKNALIDLDLVERGIAIVNRTLIP